MGGYLTTVGSMFALVVVAIVVLNRHAALGTLGQGVVSDVKSVSSLSTAGPGV